MTEKLLNVREAALRLGVKERTIRRWVYLRRVAYIKVGSALRISEGEVERLIQQGTVPRIVLSDELQNETEQ